MHWRFGAIPRHRDESHSRIGRVAQSVTPHCGANVIDNTDLQHLRRCVELAAEATRDPRTPRP